MHVLGRGSDESAREEVGCAENGDVLMDVPGKKMKGKPKRRWMNINKHDFTDN